MPPNLTKILIEVLVVLAVGFGLGWTVQQWRLGSTIADLKAEKATDRAVQAEGAVADIKAVLANMKQATDADTARRLQLASSLDLAMKEYKNAIAKVPLPVGCKPDLGRMRALAAAVDAANQAATGRKPSSAVPANSSP